MPTAPVSMLPPFMKVRHVPHLPPGEERGTCLSHDVYASKRRNSGASPMSLLSLCAQPRCQPMQPAYTGTPAEAGDAMIHAMLISLLSLLPDMSLLLCALLCDRDARCAAQAQRSIQNQACHMHFPRKRIRYARFPDEAPLQAFRTAPSAFTIHLCAFLLLCGEPRYRVVVALSSRYSLFVCSPSLLMRAVFAKTWREAVFAHRQATPLSKSAAYAATPREAQLAASCAMARGRQPLRRCACRLRRACTSLPPPASAPPAPTPA